MAVDDARGPLDTADSSDTSDPPGAPALARGEGEPMGAVRDALALRELSGTRLPFGAAAAGAKIRRESLEES